MDALKVLAAHLALQMEEHLALCLAKRIASH